MKQGTLRSVIATVERCVAALFSIRKSFILILLSGCLNVVYAASCHPINAPRLVFSSYQPIGAYPEDIDTSIDFYCAPAFQGNQVHVSVTVQDGAQMPAYQLRNAFGDVVRYGLYIDPARTIPLTSNMSIPLRDVNPGTKTFSVILYGRIFANQRTAGVGNYRGSVNLLLNY